MKTPKFIGTDTKLAWYTDLIDGDLKAVDLFDAHNEYWGTLICSRYSPDDEAADVLMVSRMVYESFAYHDDRSRHHDGPLWWLG